MSLIKRIKKKIGIFKKHLLYGMSDLFLKRNAQIIPKTLVIVKNDHIGDYILFRNFLPYISKSEKYKDYKIILIGNIVFKDIVETMDRQFYDQLFWVDFKKLTKNFSYRFRIMQQLSAQGYDTLFYPVYSGDFFTEHFLIAKIKARDKVKFAINTRSTTTVFNQLLPSSAGGMFELYRYKEMFERFLSISIEDIKGRPVYVTGKSIEEQLPKNHYIVLFPSASAYLKRWSTDHYAQVANHIIESSSYAIVIAGSKKDKKYAKAIMKRIASEHSSRVFDVTGKTSLQELAQLIDESGLLITNDSVPIHIAALYNKKAICVLMGENYGRFAPYPKELYEHGVFIFAPEISERIKKNQEEFLELDYNPDINSISPYTIIEEVDKLLGLQSIRI